MPQTDFLPLLGIKCEHVYPSNYQFMGKSGMGLELTFIMRTTAAKLYRVDELPPSGTQGEKRGYGSELSTQPAQTQRE